MRYNCIVGGVSSASHQTARLLDSLSEGDNVTTIPLLVTYRTLMSGLFYINGR